MDRKMQLRDFTTGNITKQLVNFALPLFLSNLLQVVYNMVDMIVVGRVLGEVGLSAVSLGGDVTNMMTFVAMGFSGAGQVLIAQFIGEKRTDRIGRFLGTMSLFMLTCALVIGGGGLLLRREILELMNTPAEAFDEALGYAPSAWPVWCLSTATTWSAPCCAAWATPNTPLCSSALPL